MPYIKHERRQALDPQIQRLASLIDGRGELNYVMTMLVGSQVRSLSYAELAALYGDIHLVALEFWRRVVVPYEANKCRENGDCFIAQVPQDVSPKPAEPEG